MFTNHEWEYITSLKSLTRDEHGRGWTASDDLNGYLLYLPWWAKDRVVDKTCLLYQVDSKGQLFILCILHVWRIQTSARAMLIEYKTDARHAQLEHYHVPKGRWGHLGLRSISPFDGAHAAPKMPERRQTARARPLAQLSSCDSTQTLGTQCREAESE